jgi:hypothetical protein
MEKDLNEFIAKQLGTSDFTVVDKTIEKEFLITVAIPPGTDFNQSHLKERFYGHDVTFSRKEICLFSNKYFEIVINGTSVSFGIE